MSTSAPMLAVCVEQGGLAVNGETLVAGRASVDDVTRCLGAQPRKSTPARADARNELYTWDALGLFVYCPLGTATVVEVSLQLSDARYAFHPTSRFAGQLVVEGQSFELPRQAPEFAALVRQRAPALPVHFDFWPLKWAVGPFDVFTHLDARRAVATHVSISLRRGPHA